MRNYGKKKNYCLIAALASLVAFSTMAASVMSGCGENSDEQKATEIVHETRIDTQIETKIETYTEVVTDAQGNTEYVKETKAVPVNNNAGGKTFNVGDTIVCTYNLTTPAVLENYQARIKYDSSKLTCKSAKMSEPAKNGAMLNIKIAGEISLSGVNIGDGYDYTNGGTFMTVVYEVKGGGSTSPSYHWEVACRASDSKNLIDKKGKPASGFKLSSSYKD